MNQLAKEREQKVKAFETEQAAKRLERAVQNTRSSSRPAYSETMQRQYEKAIRGQADEVKPQGPFKDPRDVHRIKHGLGRPSLRASEAYDTGKERAAEEKAKEWTMRVTDEHFLVRPIRSEYVASLMAQTKFQDNAMTNALQRDSANVSGKNDFKISTRKGKLFDDYMYEELTNRYIGEVNSRSNVEEHLH